MRGIFPQDLQGKWGPNRLLKVGAVVSGILVFLLEGPVFAEDRVYQPGSLSEELRWLQAEAITVTTVTLLEEPVHQAPATIRVITRRQIRERGYRSLHELLQDLPGIDIQNHYFAEQKNQTVIRGVGGNNKFLILQDGIRINSPTVEPVIPMWDNFPLYNVKQVEVLYGPASALYGADAFAGVINIITEEPTREGTLQVTSEGGEYDTYRVDVYGAKRVHDGLAYSLGGHYQETGAPDLSKAYPEDFVLGDLVTFSGETVETAGERADYTGRYDTFSTWAKLELGDDLTLGWNQSLIKNHLSEGDLPNMTSYDSDVESEALLLATYVKYRHEFTERLKGSIQGNYSRYEQDTDSKFKNIFSDFQDAYKYSLGERYQIEPQLTYTLEQHTITAGLTFEHFNSIPHTPDLETPYRTSRSVDDQEQFYPGSDGTLPVQFFETSYNNFGVFLQDQSEWTKKLTTTVGARFDYNEDYEGSFNPRIGAVYNATANTTWKASFAQAFLAPSTYLRFNHFGAFAFQRPDGLYQSFFFRVPNPDLEPEELQTVELSALHKVTSNLTLNVAGFYNTVDDLILFGPTDPPVSDFVPGGVIETTTQEQNIGELESYGFEVTLEQSYAWRRSRIDAWGSFSFIEGELENNRSGLETDLPFTSREMVKLGLTYNYNDRFVITPTLRWNGRQTGFTPTADDPNLGVTTPDFTLVDLYAELRNKRKNAAAFLRISNLFDEKYYRGGLSGPSTFYQSPQDPRWVTAGVRLDF